MRKLKVGVIGAGMAFEKLHYPAYQKLQDRYEIAAICDIDHQKTAKWAKQLQLSADRTYSDYRPMLERQDLDVIDIMVPIELNFEVCEDVAKRLSGQLKGIINEKPLAPSLNQAGAARDLARKYNIPIMIAENYRYNTEIDMLRDMVRTKRVGEIYYFVQNRVVDFPNDKRQPNKFPFVEWRQHPEFPGGAITDTALHDLAALRHIFGPIHRLQAFGRPQSDDFSPFSVVNVNLLFKNGITGSFNFFCAGKEMQRPLIGLRIFGNQGMIFLEERDCGTINLAFSDGRNEQVAYQPQQGYYNELINFYNALTGTEPVSVTPELEYGDLKTVMNILTSIKEERIMPVDDVGIYQPFHNPVEVGSHQIYDYH